MQRARRMGAVLGVAVLGLGGLAGCRPDPDIAAYVGRQQITRAQVDGVYHDAQVRLDAAVEEARRKQDPAAPAAAEEVRMPITRSDVLSLLVGRQVLRQVVRRDALKVTPYPVDDAVKEARLPADAQYVRDYIEYRGYVVAVAEKAAPAPLSEDDLRDVYRRLKAAGGFGDDLPYEAWRAELGKQNEDILARYLGARNALLPEMRAADVQVNPGYFPAEANLLPTTVNGKPTTVVAVPLTADPVVVDAAA